MGITLTLVPCIQHDFNRMGILNYKLNRDFVVPFIFNHSDKQITVLKVRLFNYFVTLMNVGLLHLKHNLPCAGHACFTPCLQPQFIHVEVFMLFGYLVSAISWYACLWPFRDCFVVLRYGILHLSCRYLNSPSNR